MLDRKLDEIREIFLEKNSSGFAYFGRPQGEEKYCIFTRYRGNLCGFEGYMNPHTEADGVGIIFAGLREGKWSIYRNTAVFVANTGYTPQGDISYDYFFFDPTTPRNFLFIQHHGKSYTLIKK